VTTPYATHPTSGPPVPGGDLGRLDGAGSKRRKENHRGRPGKKRSGPAGGFHAWARGGGLRDGMCRIFEVPAGASTPSHDVRLQAKKLFRAALLGLKLVDGDLHDPPSFLVPSQRFNVPGRRFSEIGIGSQQGAQSPWTTKLVGRYGVGGKGWNGCESHLH